MTEETEATSATPTAAPTAPKGGHKRLLKTLDAMKSNPKGDWNIADVEKVCRQAGLNCTPPPGGGSHYAVSSNLLENALTVPAHRPIKPFYIKTLVSLVEHHLRAAEQAEGDNNGGGKGQGSG